ncbi:MAG: SDR family NAD(P)-dependent oxidoreductase [Desulfomonile tiedjei]|nr:SDR family NAD(P)-dependent oxidoreductase [Desulfomonile tiedjei]
MPAEDLRPSIAFVWRPEEISSSVVQAARSTGGRAIFDISSSDTDSAGKALLQADAAADAVDLKISISCLLQDGLEELLEDTDIKKIWVELHPTLLEGDSGPYLERIAVLSRNYTVIPVVGSVDLITRIVNEFPQITGLALKGNEAAGFVSSENSLVLYATVREMIRSTNTGPDLFIWGGAATPEAAATFLAAGAKGIVFESLHWLTDLVAADDQTRDKISKLRPDHTDVAGSNLDIPCRLFNKGNSKAVKELKEFAGSLCGAEITDEQRGSFAKRIQSDSVHALQSQFDRGKLIPLGVEATFAASFVRRFGSKTEEAISRFIRTIDQVLSTAAKAEQAFVASAVAKEMGTKYPFVQGAMSWITDVPEFARKVADAGGLPTVALGMMDKETLDRRLGSLPEILGDAPYAVNVIALAENPHRDVQLAWIKDVKPRFAVIAAGEPSHGAELMARGINVIYIAPNEELLRLAFGAGIRYVICEGNEAGGHVGQHSTLTMAQIVLDLKNREPQLFEGRRIILAGGISNRETIFMASMLGADAVQMGTVYLTSSEIVETGALTELYRQVILGSKPGATVVTGEGTGLRVRSIKTPKMNAICALERDFAAGTEDESSFRMKIEALSAGSLFVAARGMDKPGGTALESDKCLEEGQFMSGACAGSLKACVEMKSLHEELAQGALEEGLPFTGPLLEQNAPRPSGVEVSHVVAGHRIQAPSVVEQRGPVRERIAITGMSVVNALGNSPEEIWAASLAMRSGIVPVPQARWNHEVFYHPRPRMPEKTYCKVGAFQTIEVSRKEIGVPPQDFRTMTDATKISMWLAGKAIDESGILDSDIPRERISVLISQNSGEAAATLQDVIIRGSLTHIISAVKKVLQLTPEMEAAIAEEVTSGRIAIDDTTLLGRLNCSAGGFICNKYGFMGPSFSVSAACATALVALYSAYQMIRNGIIDAAIVGGGEEFLTPMHFLEFSALGALAGLSGVERSAAETSRPFDAARDGMVLGEGGGMIVIERESVARKRGAKIHAYITSMGASNNNLGMVESSRITQEIAIGASFDDASYGPDSVDVVECHATSTRQGDVEEVQALKAFFNSGRRTVLTSFKSQIGHTLGASGINSLIRGITAMNAGIYPATLNFDEPDPDLGLPGSDLTVLPNPEEWQLRNGSPRHLQVNAFGFGGSNYVVQVEQAMDNDGAVLVQLGKPQEALEDSADSPALPDGIHFFRTEISGKPYRVAVVAESGQEALERIQNTEPFSNGGGVAAKRQKAMARQGIHVGSAEVPPPPLAFVFPGQGSHYAGMGFELYQTFPVVRQWMDRAAEVADFDLLHLLFHDREEDLQKTRWQQPALFTIEYAMVQYLASLGVRPAAMAGHSLGELTALCLAGVYSFEDGFRIVNMRAICMDKACTMNVDPGVMMAVDAPMDIVEEMLAKAEKVYITNINSPHQIVIGGDTDAVKAVGAELKQLGHRSTLLRVSMAFHSPIMRCIHDELEEFIAGIEFHAPRIPVISNTTMKPFPDDTAEIKRTVMAHLESPVNWMPNVRTLWNDHGVRLFVEVGPRDILSNLIRDIVEEADCIQTCLPSAESLVYRNAMSQLFARGNLPSKGSLKHVSFPVTQKSADTTPAEIAVRPTTAPVASALPTNLEQIVQREINAFVMESFGKFLKPALMAAIRRDYDPRFGEQGLENLLRAMFPGVDSGPVVSLPPSSQVVPTVQQAVAVPIAALPQTDQVATPESTGAEDITEAVIGIIMDATGYERDEIEPEMDLREDLSIRSSRLPVIIDAVEGHFHIKIDLEEFMDARTIQDISDRILAVLSRQACKKVAPAQPPAGSAQTEPARMIEPAEENQTLKRVVFTEAPLEPGDSQPVELDLMDTVAVLAAEGGTGLRQEVGGIFRRDYGISIAPMAFMDVSSESEEARFDLRTHKGAADAVGLLQELQSLSGIVIILDDAVEKYLDGMETASAVLEGFFSVLKAFLDTPAKKFVLMIHKSQGNAGTAGVLAQGMVGMFLSAALEFASVQFRTVRLDANTDLRDAIRGSLDRSRKPIETIYRDGKAYTTEGRVQPCSFHDAPGLQLSPGDVVVFSGGGSGITPFLARSLAPFGCKMVFLGRTELDPDINFRKLIAESGDSGEIAEKLVSSKKPSMSGKQRLAEISKIARAVDIVRNVEELRSAGAEASYFSCDVADPEKTRAVVDEIVKRYGKIDGIVHGAGVLRDGFIKQMTPVDFSAVVNVKFLGAWNLFSAASKAGLKFFTCLSSAASVQGNPGQANYAAGNRIMSALVSHLRSAHEEVRFKAMMLPPIEGAGMAEDPEIKVLMKRMNAAYVHVDELGELFCRELFVAPPEDVWVLFMRSLPDLSQVRLEMDEPVAPAGKIHAGAVMFRNEDFPMIDSVSRMDLLNGELEATRSFSQTRDLWIADHKPFKFLKHPLVSAIMALETFMEACRILYPHLRVRGVREARFLDIIECPAGTTRPSEVSCRRVSSGVNGVQCEVTLSTREISPSGRIMDRLQSNFKAIVMLASYHAIPAEDLPGFPVKPEELESRPMDHDEALEWYQNRTDMQDRYRVIEDLDGTSAGAIRGRIIYKQGTDFAPPLRSRYQYSPYLLEALMQVVNFYIAMRDPDEPRSMIPYRIGEMMFFRKCAAGEEITLEARMKSSDEKGITWNARALDETGRVLMNAKDIMMRWFSK